MTLLKCKYLIFTNLFFCYFHSYCYNFKISGEKLHLFTLFNNQSLVQLIFGRLWKHASALAIQSNDDNSKTFEWQVFSLGWWGLDFPIAHHISNSWCATRNPVPDSTYHLADLKSVTTESQNVSPCMTATPWRRVNWKICDENSTFSCFDAIGTQFNVTWPHCGTVRDFFGSFNHRPHSRQVTGARCTGGRGSPVMSWIFLKANNGPLDPGVGDKRFFHFKRNALYF